MASPPGGSDQGEPSPPEIREQMDALVRPLDYVGCLSWLGRFWLLIAFLVALTKTHALFTGGSWLRATFYALLICVPPLILAWWLVDRLLCRNHLQRMLQRFDTWFPPGGARRQLAVADLLNRPDASNRFTGTGRLIAALRDRGDPLIFGPLDSPEKILADALGAAGQDQPQQPRAPEPPAGPAGPALTDGPVLLDTRDRTARPDDGSGKQGADWFAQLSNNRPLPLELDPPIADADADEEKPK